MALKLIGSIDLPGGTEGGEFDHTAYEGGTSRLFVAHTSNNSVDAIDCELGTYLFSIEKLDEVDGVLASQERGLVITSNRGENTVALFSPEDPDDVVKVPVGVRPDGLAFDAGRIRLLVANVGDPDVPGSRTASSVDVERRVTTASVEMPGRTRWALFDAMADLFYVNTMDPAQIVVTRGDRPDEISRTIEIAAAGPHGLDQDDSGRLFCACDGRVLLSLDPQSGEVSGRAALGGVPDVIFFDSVRRNLYVAIGEPRLFEVYDSATLQLVERVNTERGAHTIGFDPERNQIYGLLPTSHRAALYLDEP